MSLVISRTLGAVLLCGLLAACGNNTTPNLQSTLGPPDTTFITGATQSSNAEISDANVALTKSQNADVIAFANEMIAQHTQQKTALAPIATSVGVAPPNNVNPVQAAQHATLLAVAPGAPFDAAYINGEITGHSLNLSNNFNPEIASGKVSAVVAYAQKYLPQVQMHLQMAQTIKTKYGF